MIIDTGGEFLKGDDLKGGEIVTILDEGSTSEIQITEGKTKTVTNFRVDLDGKEKTYTPNIFALRKLVDAWGAESKKWVNQQFEVEIVAVFVAGQKRKTIEPIPITNKRGAAPRVVKRKKV